MTPSTHAPVHPSSSALEDIQRILEHETTIWGKLHHPNIIEMIEVMDVDDAMFVVSELAEAGNLLDYLTKRGGPLPEPEARRIFRQIASAVRYLHTDAQVVHRDIKLENVLLTYTPGSTVPTVKLADFGLSDHITTSPPPSPATLAAADPIFCQGPSITVRPRSFARRWRNTPRRMCGHLGVSFMRFSRGRCRSMMGICRDFRS
ncbi:kinase-like domain-containing protein [Chytridium lagenaria]|nr:kinase-like domain-containing protein [Chytridium lagenaria]